MFRTIREDIRTVFDKDRAARSLLEVLFCYPGPARVWNHRVAHFFWTHHLNCGRLTSHCSRSFRDEIHPEQKSDGGFSSTMVWVLSSAKPRKLGTTC